MQVFVTGGSGFVGRHLLRRLVASGHSVTALARSPKAETTVASAGARAVRGDLASPTGDGEDWVTALQGADAVVHVAARMQFWGPDAGFIRDNHLPTLALHAAAADAGVRRFVLLSAASVSTGRAHGPAVVSERTATGRPNIAYSRVKLATEQALSSADTPGMTLITLRPPFIWGPGMTTLDEMVAAVRARRFAWIDHGRHTMDFVHVANLTDAMLLALTAGRHRKAYYVTDGTPLPIRQFLTPLLATRGVDVSSAPSVPLAVASTMGHVMDGAGRLLRRPTAPPLTNWLVSFMGRDRSYDITAARHDLGYQPTTGLAEGVEQLRVDRPDSHPHAGSTTPQEP